MISTRRKIVAIASSTGGPRALQELIPLLPANLNAPVCLVQHMPSGFTEALARRLDQISPISVSEAVEGESIEKGHVYLARGGNHMILNKSRTTTVIGYTDAPHREGVKPCANYMYESLMDCDYDEVVCVVLTGMGADGTEGITNLKTKKKVSILVQSEASCTVYGMPRAAVKAGLATEGMELKEIAKAIIEKVGVY